MTQPSERQRFWGVTFVGAVVLVRHYPVLAPGEDLTEDTPTIRLTKDEWLQRHAEWGLDVDGNRLEVQR